ncbi:DUF167 domain-containing protein [Oligoflexia bacterium]|nr:DUF167 domain-containing protein [Oligoflexia bacterium]
MSSSKYPFAYINSPPNDKIHLEIALVPRASKMCIAGVHDQRLKIHITAAPVDGQANKALIAFLAKSFGCRKSGITIEQGHTSRKKLISFDGVEHEKFWAALDELLNNA